MKIGIDISQIVYEGTGVSRFTKGLVNSILNYDATNEWIFFFSSLRRKLNTKLENKILHKGHKLIKWKLPPTLLSFFWNDLHAFSKSYMLHVASFKYLDWFITSDWTEPPLLVNKATVVHDLVYIRFPETVDSRILVTQKKRLSWVKKESKIIFADSQATKDGLTNLLNIDQKKIYLNYPGVEIEKPSRQDIAKTLKKHNLIKPFMLSVGKLEPRKNLNRLITAYLKLKDSNIDLVIVGPKGWITNNQQLTINNHQSRIKFLGLVSDEELYSLYSSCLFFIYPSIWEGFGYPVVEAMKLGVPVATSNTSSLSEISNDTALLFNPFDPKDILRCIHIMIQDVKLRSKLANEGLERSKIFTWKNYYENMISTLKSFPRKRESI